MKDISIIYCAPCQDGEKDTVTNGHKLYPRFISYADGNFKDVASVLGKMLEEI